MRFEHKGKLYALEFSRDYRQISYKEGLTVRSERPYTTVTILEITEPDKRVQSIRKVYRTATVGCWHKEPVFTLEKGRLHALRAVSKSVDKDFKRAMWDAYQKRTSNDTNTPAFQKAALAELGTNDALGG